MRLRLWNGWRASESGKVFPAGLFSLTIIMKVITICDMSSSRKAVALLLSLMLAMLPLQGLFASGMVMPAGPDIPMSGIQADMNHASMTGETATECSDCAAKPSCCDGSSCDLHQCASCVVTAFLPQSFVHQPQRASMVVSPSPSGNLLSRKTSLYRPPQV